MSSTTICRGNVHESFYISAALTPAAVTSTSSNQTFTVPGLLSTDTVVVVGYVGTQTAGIAYAEAEPTAANTLQIQFVNVSGSSATPGAGQYILQIIRFEGPLPATAV
jgi:hypothetical protein